MYGKTTDGSPGTRRSREARAVRGPTRAENAEACLRRLGQTGLHDCRATPGNVSVLGLRRVAGQQARFLLVTLRRDEEAIGRFEGRDDVGRAVFYPEDEHYLARAARSATHHDVVYDRRGARATGHPSPPGGHT